MDDGQLTFPDDSTCFGCSASHPIGLRLRFDRDGDTVSTSTVIPDRFHGAPGIAHGGIVATVLDEVSCAAVYFVRGHYVLTGELSVRYEKPCPVDQLLAARARVTAEHARYLVVEAELSAGDVVLARSRGKFFPQANGTAVP